MGSLKRQFEDIATYHNVTSRIALEDVTSLHAQIVQRLSTVANKANSGQVPQLVRIANAVTSATIVSKAIYETQDKSAAFGQFLEVLDKQTGEI